MSATFVWLPDVAEPDAPTERLMKVTPASASQIHRMPPPPEVYRTSRSILRRPSTVIAIAESTGVTDDVTLWRSEEHTSELQSLMRISYAVFCLKKKKKNQNIKKQDMN